MRAPWCPTCGGTGLVLYDRQVEDRPDSGKARTLTYAYRCRCPAGEAVTDALALVPLRALPGPER